MDDGYLFRKFTDKDLDNFDLVEKQVSKIPHIKESLELFFTEMYAFSNYIAEKKLNSNKKLKSKIVKRNNNLAISSMLEETKTYEENLTIKERLYIAKLKNLYILQEKRLNIHSSFTTQAIRNNINFFNEEHENIIEDNIKKLYSLSREKGQASLSVTEWIKNSFITILILIKH